MISSEVRLTNLLYLHSEFEREELARGTVQHGSVRRFAERANMSPQYFSHIKNRRKKIGSALARRIETATGRPYGWLDADHASERHREFTPEELAFFETYEPTYDFDPEAFKLQIAVMLAMRLIDAVRGG